MLLRTRLIIAAGLVLAVIVTAGLLLPSAVRSSQIREVDQQLVAALPVALQLTPAAGGVISGAAPAAAPAADALSDIYIAVIDGAKREVVLPSNSQHGCVPSAPPVTSKLPATPHASTVGCVHGAGSWRAILGVLPNGARLLVAIPLDRVNATTRHVTDAGALAGGLILLVLAAAGWWLWRLGLRPVSDLTTAADAITAGDRSRRADPGRSGTEVAHLAHAFNLMLDEQQAIEARLRQFISDASHELRTPVAAIGGFAELWQTGGISPDGEDDMMRRIGTESRRMRALVEDLLLLARLDEGLPLMREHVDVGVIAADTAVAARATHPSRTVSVTVKGEAIVLGDETRLRQVVANLVTNALHYTTGDVTIDVAGRADLVRLTVADRGPGMSPDQLSRAFDRFWRGDSSRGGPGTGLGLSIVRGVVTTHGGQIRLTSAPDQGTRAVVVLPVGLEGPPSPKT